MGGDDWAAVALKEIAAAPTVAALEALRVQYLGKQGRATVELRALSDLPPGERRARGVVLNGYKAEIESALAQRREMLAFAEQSERLAAERLDMTLPGVPPAWGTLHPITRVRRRLADVMLRLGFTLCSGPELETEWYNFEALNMPADHPAREMHDTFYVEAPYVLRTHTSPVQIRAMRDARGELPLRVATLGFTYRRDDDATHTPQFMQMEGLVVDRGIGLPDLKGVVLAVVRDVFGPTERVRLRPSFFPFTEPSVEVDISCLLCAGAGCRVCKQSGWTEILGAGMIHHNVFRAVGYDPARWQGFAFGMGVERIALLKLGVDDLRLFFENDARFLGQFPAAGLERV